MAAVPSVFLVFNGSWLEVDRRLVQRRGCLRLFAREAESKWDLSSGSFELRHTSGKVDSCAALKEAVDKSANGVCQLEIVESIEGKMMRTMRKEMQDMEDRLMAKLGSALADAHKEGEEEKRRLNGAIAPLVQCLASEQIEMRERISQLASQVGDVSTPADNELSVKGVDVLEAELDQECAKQSACDLDLTCEDKLQEIQEQVSQLGQRAATTDTSAHQKAAVQEVRGATIDFKQSLGYADSWLQAPQAPAPVLGYSSKYGKGVVVAPGFEAKWHPGEKFSVVKLGDVASTPFAAGMYSSKSTLGHRSCPLLPPLN